MDAGHLRCSGRRDGVRLSHTGPLRVLHVVSSFPRWPGEPSAPFLLDLARAQAAAGMEVQVLAPHDAGLPHSERWGAVGVTRFRYAPAGLERLAYRGGMLGAASALGGTALVPGMLAAMSAATTLAARRLHPDVINAHWWFPGGLAGTIASAATGVPLVVTLHGSDVHLAGRPGWGAPARAVLGRAGAVVAVSQHLAAEAARCWGVPAERVGVARMPMSIPDAGMWALPPLPPIRVVFVGRLVPEKGLDVLLRAMSLAVAEGLDLRLDVVGDGPDSSALRAQAAALGERVSWAGALPHAEVGAHLLAAHAVVVPSRREGLGLVALEALAHGRPVIASAVGGLVEVVVNGVDGVLVPPGNPAALAQALAKVPLGAPAGAALDRHRPEAVAIEHLELYQKLVASRATPPVRALAEARHALRRTWRAPGSHSG